MFAQVAVGFKKVELQIILYTAFPGQLFSLQCQPTCLAWDLGTVRQDAESVFWFVFFFSFFGCSGCSEPCMFALLSLPLLEKGGGFF